MRDFRHAKDMAHTLRASLAAKGFKITVSQSLELIAEAFGMADWNTLSLPRSGRRRLVPAMTLPRLTFRPPEAVLLFPCRLLESTLRFPPRLNRLYTGLLPMPIIESTSTRRWSTFCSP